MAGIEKICEFSGEYSTDMYWYKHAQLQVLPQYRKRFKGADAILHKFKTHHVSEFQSTIDYCLEVKDGNLKGRVNGFYYNWILKTRAPWGNEMTKFSTVRRKLARLLGYKPKVIRHNHENWVKCDDSCKAKIER